MTVTLLFVDRVGQKRFLVVGSVGMAVTLAMLVFAFVNATTAADGSLSLEGIYGPMALVAANLYFGVQTDISVGVAPRLITCACTTLNGGSMLNTR